MERFPTVPRVWLKPLWFWRSQSDKQNKQTAFINREWVKTVVTFMSWLDNHLGPVSNNDFFSGDFFAIFFFELQVYGGFFTGNGPNSSDFHTQKVVRFLWWIPVSSQKYRRMLRFFQFVFSLQPNLAKSSLRWSLLLLLHHKVGKKKHIVIYACGPVCFFNCLTLHVLIEGIPREI